MSKKDSIILQKQFYLQDGVKVSQKLLGSYLVVNSNIGQTVGKIVETESYLGLDDPASHSFRGKSLRNEAMFKNGGHAYVYKIYGVHFCFNVVTGKEGKGEAVLIRALEPIEGVELMKQRRGVEDIKNLCNGPAKLVQAMAINLNMNGTDLVKGPINILKGDQKVEIVTARRVGITKGADLPLRFYIKDNQFISHP